MKYSHKILYILGLLSILMICYGCASKPSDEVIQTAIAQTELAQPQSTPYINYTIINIEHGSSTKCLLYVRLLNKISESEIGLIAEYIKQNEGVGCSPIYIYYYLPNEEPGKDSAWAYSNFNPQLEVKITGLDLDTEATLSASIPLDNESLVGTWLDTWGYPRTIVIRKINGSYQMTTLYGDGSGETKTLSVEVVNGKERFTIPEDFFTGYMVIKSNGNLAFYDIQGYIYEALSK